MQDGAGGNAGHDQDDDDDDDDFLGAHSFFLHAGRAFKLAFAAIFAECAISEVASSNTQYAREAERVPFRFISGRFRAFQLLSVMGFLLHLMIAGEDPDGGL